MEKIENKIDLTRLSLEELNKVILDAKILITKKEFELREQRKVVAKTSLIVGDHVKVVSKRFDDEELFKVLKLNPKKAKCKRANGETWYIPYTNIIT